MAGYTVYDWWRRGDSLRVIQEIHPTPPDYPMGVIYSLYRREFQYSQDPAKRKHIWVYRRQGYCKTATFERWLKGATKITNDKELRDG